MLHVNGSNMAHGPSNIDHDGRVVGLVHGDDGWRGVKGDEGPRRGGGG